MPNSTRPGQASAASGSLWTTARRHGSRAAMRRRSYYDYSALHGMSNNDLFINGGGDRRVNRTQPLCGSIGVWVKVPVLPPAQRLPKFAIATLTSQCAAWRWQRYEPFFRSGTLLPERRASLKAIAIACLRLFTRFPDRPEVNFPRFISSIVRFTFFETPRHICGEIYFGHSLFCDRCSSYEPMGSCALSPRWLFWGTASPYRARCPGCLFSRARLLWRHTIRPFYTEAVGFS